MILVLVVGTMPVGSDSLTFGIKILISLALIKILSCKDAIPITFILNRLAYFNMFDNSVVLPE